KRCAATWSRSWQSCMSRTSAGTGLSYQWQFNGVNLDGATTASLQLPEVQTTQAGQYAVLVTNSVGKVASAIAMLTVISPPSIMDVVGGMQPTNQPFQVTLNVDPGYVYSLEATTDFATWLPIATITDANGLFDFADQDSTNYVNRFYRLHWSR
ncbi:MAG TPA: hypothetical protein VK327_16705, partial [Candidatus Paceibacterota bacterium]|nr:hypothetical protein [Candidatus Paceibacterota bacterium]